MKKAIFQILPAISLCLFLLAENAFSKSKLDEELVSMNFNNMDIVELVKIISEWTGENFLLDSRIRGQVTIISPRKVTKREALQIFHSILYANDLAIVKVGNLTKIVPASEVRQSPGEIVKEKKLLPSEDYITTIITPSFADANQISGVIRNFLSRNGFLQVYQPTNTIILIETRANTDRIMKIIDELDKIPYTFRIEVIKLKYSNAQDVVNIITQIIQAQLSAGKKAGLGPQAQPKIIADTRTNSLVVAAEPEDILYIKDIVEKVDIPVEMRQVNVINLKYAKAEDVLQVLQNIVDAGARAGGVPGGAQVVQAPVRLAADKSTNSLIIVAAPQDFEKIKEIISKIDIERKQVFVSAIIMEISSSRLAQYGLSFLAGKDVPVRQGGELKKGVGIFGESLGTPLPFSLIDPKTLSTISGLLFGFTLPPATVEIGGQTISIPPLAAVLNTLASDTQVDIISTPHILTMDNKEAEIRVATNIPFPTGQIFAGAGVGGAIVPTITIQRQDVGIILKITPHIIEHEKKILLDVNVEISDVSEEPPPGLAVQQLGIATIKRSSTTSVLVSNEETIVIGGLMRTRRSYSRAKVPIIGDLPVIGILFRSSQKRTQKSNLLLFITPKIIQTKADVENIKEKMLEKEKKLREEEGLY